MIEFACDGTNGYVKLYKRFAVHIYIRAWICEIIRTGDLKQAFAVHGVIQFTCHDTNGYFTFFGEVLSTCLFLWGHELGKSLRLFRLQRSFLQIKINFS